MPEVPAFQDSLKNLRALDFESFIIQWHSINRHTQIFHSKCSKCFPFGNESSSFQAFFKQFDIYLFFVYPKEPTPITCLA